MATLLMLSIYGFLSNKLMTFKVTCRDCKIDFMFIPLHNVNCKLINYLIAPQCPQCGSGPQ